MPDTGKIDAEFFDEHIYRHLGAGRKEVALGPQHGVDFGVVELDSNRPPESDAGGDALVVATDPISILPALGFERAAEFALDVVLADVAVSGLTPAYLSISFTLPPEMTDAEFAQVWETIDREATSLGTSVVAGHTARYAGCAYPWVGGATVFAIGDREDLIRPDGARPGDRLVVTTGPGVEAVGLLTTLFGDQMDLPETTLSTARERFADARGVRDALAIGAAGSVTAMHDVTEGGLRAALCEMAASAGVRIDVESARVPMRPGVEAVCEHLDIDPWAATSSGTLLVAVRPDGVDAVLAALEDRGTAAAVVGRVTDGTDAHVDGKRIEPPTVDPSLAVYAEYANST